MNKLKENQLRSKFKKFLSISNLKKIQINSNSNNLTELNEAFRKYVTFAQRVEPQVSQHLPIIYIGQLQLYTNIYTAIYYPWL